MIQILNSEVTWIGNGVLYGEPTKFIGCETVCGTKQAWSVGVTPAIVTDGLSKKEIYAQIIPTLHQFVIGHSAQDSSGGACIGDYHSDNQGMHKYQVTIKHTKDGKKAIRDSKNIVVGGNTIFVPIVSRGAFAFTFNTLEWGEDCNKPDNQDVFKVIVSEAPLKITNNTHIMNEVIPPGGVESPINITLIGLLMLGGIGALLFTKSLFSSKSYIDE